MDDSHTRVAEQVNAVFADMTMAVRPGSAVLVVEKGTIAHKQGYGFAHLEESQPIRPDTSFYLASLSKQFTAMAIMMLVEQQLLKYEQYVSTFFPISPTWGKGITIHYLLHHTSGLPDYISLFTHHSSDENIIAFTNDITNVSNQDVLRLMMQLPETAFPVGEQYRYSNSGYILLALIVEAVSGQPFSVFLKHHIFDPLGMQSTLVYDSSRPVIHQLAQGYIQQGEHYQSWDYPLLTTGDGGMFSTLDDLFLWDRVLNTEQLVTATTLERAFASGKTRDGKLIGYGFGWMTTVYEGLRHVAHGGSLGAFNNYFIRFLDNQLTIIVLCNHRCVPGPRALAHRVAEIYISGNESRQ